MKYSNLNSVFGTVLSLKGMAQLRSYCFVNWLSVLAFFTFQLLISGKLAAQEHLDAVRGAGDPGLHIVKDMYLDTVSQVMWSRHYTEWLSLKTPIANPVTKFGNMTIIPTKIGYYVDRQVGGFFLLGDKFKIEDSLLTVWSEERSRVNYLTKGGNLLSPMYGADSRCWKVDHATDSVFGRPAYCIPSFILIEDCNSLRCWGMLGTNGRWLIAPIYDAPFHFKNGVAEVLSYGQKRKINEKGEFVE